MSTVSMREFLFGFSSIVSRQNVMADSLNFRIIPVVSGHIPSLLLLTPGQRVTQPQRSPAGTDVQALHYMFPGLVVTSFCGWSLQVWAIDVTARPRPLVCSPPRKPLRGESWIFFFFIRLLRNGCLSLSLSRHLVGDFLWQVLVRCEAGGGWEARTTVTGEAVVSPPRDTTL